MTGLPDELRIPGAALEFEIAAGKGRYLVIRGTHGAHRVALAVNDERERPSIALRLDASLLLRLACLEALASGKPALPPRLRPTPYQAGRLGLMLAILDRLEDEGNGPASLRAIAAELVFPGADLPTRAVEWKSSSLKRQTQRLVAIARSLRDGGYRNLLQGRTCAARTSAETCPVPSGTAG